MGNFPFKVNGIAMRHLRIDRRPGVNDMTITPRTFLVLTRPFTAVCAGSRTSSTTRIKCGRSDFSASRFVEAQRLREEPITRR
jgi:hypothetical protein